MRECLSPGVQVSEQELGGAFRIPLARLKCAAVGAFGMKCRPRHKIARHYELVLLILHIRTRTHSQVQYMGKLKYFQ